MSISVDAALLDEIVRRLVAAIDLDRIILFGSRARGDARADSDIDLLIVKETDQPVYRRAGLPGALGTGSAKGHHLENSG